MLTLLQHPALARTLGCNARQWANEHLSWPTLAERIEHVYYELLEPHVYTAVREAPMVGLGVR
jgi:hypothetical protein